MDEWTLFFFLFTVERDSSIEVVDFSVVSNNLIKYSNIILIYSLVHLFYILLNKVYSL